MGGIEKVMEDRAIAGSGVVIYVSRLLSAIARPKSYAAGGQLSTAVWLYAAIALWWQEGGCMFPRTVLSRDLYRP